MRDTKESGPRPLSARLNSRDGVDNRVSVPSHKAYKMKFLAAENTQRSQWGVVEAFKRYDTLEAYLGWLQPSHAGYKEFNYAALRGWKD